ncbi:MAG: hypothetical protein E7676_04105 [Ruminococcaceae bacterium]|nr:hypothetical protein [Oscillospiraceae bacterium]
MSLNSKFILVNNVKMPINASEKEAFSVAKGRLSRLGLAGAAAKYSIYRRSVDARKKPDIYFVYSVLVEGSFNGVVGERLARADMALVNPHAKPEIVLGDGELSAPPLIVGAGPAGLFAALLLAESGYNPVILERGGSVAERQEAVRKFNLTHILDTDTNIQFGAGGAGTFSDGKLVTRVNDALSGYILERFVEFGAPEDIRYIAKPHIGTDILSLVVERMIDRICALGGSIHYHTKFISPIISGGELCGVKTDGGDFPAGALILAIGHSARDTYMNLISGGFVVEPKPFSVGMRIEHLTEDIDRAMYGDMAGDERLGHAEYALSNDTKARGTYTFCMCPGGEVVAAASEDGGVVVNGMSYHSRSGRNSNSAVVATIFREDYGATPTAAIEFQRNIERRAFQTGGGEYRAPIITVGDFLHGKQGSEPTRITPTYMNGENVRLANPNDFLPSYVCDSIKSAILAFDRKISGFAAHDAILTGAETRTSAPVRIMRDPETRVAVGYRNIYPAGEGAGYAGGITSAALDGAKSALALMKVYRPISK